MKPDRQALLWRGLELAVLALLPVALLLRGGELALGMGSVDLQGHLWMGWHAGREGLLQTELLGWPQGLDLLPVLGGWLDVWLVGVLEGAIGLIPAYNAVIALYVFIAGLGGAALSRSLDAPRGAWVAGLLLQLDGFLLLHLQGGRPEQVGLGFVALSAAAAVRLLRLPPDAPALKALGWGALGALVLFVSWELALLTVLCLALVLPFQLRRERLRALGLGALGALALGGPWVLLFLVRAGGVRAADEGGFALETAQRASVGLLGWLAPGIGRPTWAALLCLPALPWLLRGPRRWGPLLGLAALLLLLALGPVPGLMEPGQGAPWGPFHWMQRVPLLGWFHWPERLLAGLSVLAVAAAGVAVQTAGPRWGAGLSAVLVLGAALEMGPRVPEGTYPLPLFPELAVLESLPEGAVLDLPIQPAAAHHLPYQMMQIRHERPILFNMVLDHLRDDSLDRRVESDPVLRWFRALMEPGPPPQRDWGEPELRALREQGFVVVALHQPSWPLQRWGIARKALMEELGAPLPSKGNTWLAWPLPERSEPQD